MEVNGIAHIFLTASNFERSREFPQAATVPGHEAGHRH
jgi:hypothetical protein